MRGISLRKHFTGNGYTFKGGNSVKIVLHPHSPADTVSTLKGNWWSEMQTESPSFEYKKVAKVYQPYPVPVITKKGKRKVQAVLQSQTAALPRQQEEEETDKTKQAQIDQTYEKH